MTQAPPLAISASSPDPARCRRVGLALAVAAFHLLVAYAVLTSGAVRLPPRVQESITLVRLPPLPAPPVAVQPRLKGAAAPANREARAVPREAPPPVLIVIPPPVAAAPVASAGSDLSTGAAADPGPGSGAGGGDGSGTGASGDGDGEGGSHSEWRSGRIRDSDYPRALRDAGIGGTVTARIAVGIDGRVSGCAVTGSSGNAQLDAVTCRLIVERFRYRPGRDAGGRPVADEWTEEHNWVAGTRDGSGR